MHNRTFSAVVLASSLAFLLSASPMRAQESAKQDMRHAGTETKDAARDTGHGVAKGSKDAYHSTKRGTKRAYHKTKRGVKKAHRKMDPDRTSSNNPN